MSQIWKKQEEKTESLFKNYTVLLFRLWLIYNILTFTTIWKPISKRSFYLSYLGMITYSFNFLFTENIVKEMIQDTV